MNNEYRTHVHSPSGKAELLTVNGEYFQFEDEDDTRGLDIESIAHALACTPRFRGHTYAPCSVAQHSVYVSRYCAPEDALWGLLHDAAEAYLGDVASPAKRRLLPDFCREEEKILKRVARYYGLPSEIPASVHKADAILCATEARDLMPEGEWEKWNMPYPPLPDRMVPLHWWHAKRDFLRRYEDLTGEFEICQ